MRWHFDFDLDRYETDPRGPWVGIVWKSGDIWRSSLLHLPSMKQEDQSPYATHECACDEIEALLVERVPVVSGKPARSRPDMHYTPFLAKSSASLPYRVCDLCGVSVALLDFTKHLVEKHNAVGNRKHSPFNLPRTNTVHSEMRKESQFRYVQYSSKHGKRSICCSICNQVVQYTAIGMHIGVYHPYGSRDQMCTCLLCNTEINHNDYWHHLSSEHADVLVMKKRKKKKENPPDIAE